MADTGNLSALALPVAGSAVIGYLLGSLPFGYLVARTKGVNIFAEGSKSPGATNVRRVVGAKAGNLVFVLDAVKGMLAAGWPMVVALLRGRRADPLELAELTATAVLLGTAGLIGALVGHSFSCFTGFRGGKGVSTGAGGFLVLMPIGTLLAALVWVVLFFGVGYVSLASIAAAVTIPVASFLLHQPSYLTAIASAVAIFVIFRHRANLGRLAAGTEAKRGGKPPVPR